MKYLVIVQRDVTYGEAEGPGTGEPDEVSHQEVSKVISCDDVPAVSRAVRENSGWSVWEVTLAGVQRRAVAFNRAGEIVEIG